MPEPSGVDDNGNDMATTYKHTPRPKPRLSLVIARNEDSFSLPPYENISNGWSLSVDDEHKAKKKKENDMSSTSGRKDLLPRGGSFSGIRRSTLPLSPSALHSNIPVPRRVSTSLSTRSGFGFGSTTTTSDSVIVIGRGGGGSNGGNTSSSTVATSSEGSTLKCMPYNSPRPVPKSTQSNGHANSAAKSGTTTNSRLSATTSKLISVGFRGLDNSRRLNQVLGLQPESKKLSVSAGALQSSSFVTQMKQSVIMRNTRVPLCRGASVDVLNDSPPYDVESQALKTEYRKSVSIPPRLVANMTSRFNALIEKNHFGSSSCLEHKVEIVTDSAEAEVPVAVSFVSQCSSSTRSSSSLMLLNDVRRNVSRIQKPRTRLGGKCPTSKDAGYVSATDDAVVPSKEKNEDVEKPCLVGTIRILENRETADRAVVSPNSDDVVSNESKLSSVKQAIRNYEVALLKNSASSPELQRKPSLPKEVVVTSRQSKTLPTIVSSRTLLQSEMKTNCSVATLPNIPFRSSLRASSGCGLCQTSSFIQYTGYSKSDNGREADSSTDLGSAAIAVCGSKLQAAVAGSTFTTTPGSPPIAALRTLSKPCDKGGAKPHDNRVETTSTKPAPVVARPSEVSISSPLASPKISANSRGRMLFQMRAATQCSKENTSAVSAASSRSSSLDRASTLMGSMDLLAEIDNHPSLLPIATRSQHRPLSTSSSSTRSEKCSSTGSVAPNASFLWRESTQSQVSVKQKQDCVSSNGDVAVEGDLSVYDAFDEPIYEELVNCTSAPPLPPPSTQLSHRDLPLPLPDFVGDFSSSSSSSSDGNTLPQDRTSYDFDSKLVSSHLGELVSTSIDDNDKQDACIEAEESDEESWIDDSDSDDGAGNAKTSTLSSKTRSRTKRQTGRRTCLLRRSWSQSLRDLAGSHSNEGTALEDLESGGWEEGFGSDESSDNAQSIVTIAKSEEAVASSSPQTDSDDKSPVSMHSEEASDNKDTNTKDEHAKEWKGKRVKRNWSWSKSDFRLDLSSKLGKIRLTNNQKKQQQQDCVEKGEVDSSVTTDVSPSKKKQWTFKAKFSTKRVGGPLSPKRSPVKENAQFYVPTYNDDGTLATSPCCEATQSISEYPSSVAEPMVLQCDDETRTSRKTRRVSSCGTLSRPKNAPPAPPVSSVKVTAEPPPPPLPPPNFSTDFACGRDSKSRSSVSLDHGSGCRSNSDQSGKSSAIRYSQSDLGKLGAVSSIDRSSSVHSCDTDVADTVSKQKRASSSAFSVHSESSIESYTQVDTLRTISRVQDELSLQFSDSRQDAVGERVAAAKKCSSLEREQQIGQLEFTKDFVSDPNRMSKLSPFEDEPLYQFYNIAARQRAARENQVEISDLEDEDDADSCYESIYQFVRSTDSEIEDEEEQEATERTKTSAMDLVRSTVGGTRTLWCEVPEVRSSGILDIIAPQKRKLQEAMFEVITSEASYLKSLNVLVECFVHCPQLSDDYSMDCVLNKRERYVLFSDVVPVKETSERLLADLEKRWQQSIVISDICDILQEHATKYFDVYVRYCSNQLYQDRCLKKLKEENNLFIEVLQRLESNPVCQNLSMYSFLMLPMQRITRLPLLVDAIFNRLEFGTKQYETCKQALATLNKIVHECNEGAHRMERMEEMLIISRQLDFRECKCLALISASRWLVKKGDLTRLTFGDSSSRLSFGRRCARQSVYLFLFTDLLIVTKKKSDDCYNVLDYCPRNLVHATEIESPEQLPGRTHDGHRNIFQLSMLQNHDNKTVEMFFSCPKESDLTRWVEAVTPRKSENPGERIYEEWDCPQVQALHAYIAQQPDELSLEESDVVNVFRKITDGWYQGERIRDGVQGWFPSNYTVEIVSSHIRARNLRQRYRLLALSHSYVENQRKKEQNKGK